ncbi:hypothetical protein TTHERM_00220650 (macronuclear) [Tetrahymena thermophila SB210]|uniref:Uncharacterized protein n=1 Tax=Tetrahymena thermophila (strain SB210) TaxID=312017 RepID=I7LVZ4_TETTS|nr:hypothetical protein TTHERM_00220650 [Tetrahymena thermophila SB210]EAS00392.3 hypothetical protein TTHERM_00220650 [Tetrahymena thermophila SB210]|eukprot:XP_001020637.3 hypothetical protein TTHERM_00220650 [Tetrahymena thermophila SB210]
MSYIFSENYIKQKLKRLEEINEYNRARLAMFNRKKAFMSRKEYERYKNILFGTDYKSLRESLQNTQNKEKNNGSEEQDNTQSQQQQQQQQLKTGLKGSKSQGKVKQMSQTAGNIISTANNKNKMYNNGLSQANYTGGFQQKSNQNEDQKFQMNNSGQQEQQEYVDKRYSTPQQQSLEENQIFLNEGDNQHNYQNNFNMVTFNSADKKMNTFNPQATSQDTGLYQTQNYEDFDYEQQQLIKYIKKIEVEKQELENELYEIQLKAANLNLQSNRKNQKSIFEEVFKEQEEYIPIQTKSLLNIRKQSPTQSPLKLKQSHRESLDSLQKIPNYRQLQKKIGLDFETQWDLLEKWESLNAKYPVTPNPFFISTQSEQKQYESAFNFQDQSKSSFWDSINQMKKETQGVNAQKKAIHTYLPEDENWETKFNKIGKSYEERYTAVDNDIYFGSEFVGRKNSKPFVNKYVVNKYTIDKLSDDIDFIMRQSRLNNSPFKSLKSQSPFKNKRSLYEIPEEFSQDNSHNYYQ